MGLNKTNKTDEDPLFIEYAHKVNDLYYKMEKYGYTSWYNKKWNIFDTGFNQSEDLFDIAFLSMTE